MGDIRLIVQADDCGMCRAVNEGIALAKTDGILTQTSVMAPTPWFAEGALMAKRLGVATGLHVTLTCDWEYLRWGPLTAAASLRDDQGLFKNTVRAAAEGTAEDGVAEALAQVDRALALGLELSYVDPHMGLSIIPAYEAACARLGVKFMYPGVDPHHVFDSVTVLSVQSRRDRAAWFADFLEQLTPGTHMVQTHPAVASAELRAVTPEHAENYFWVESTRVPDLEALCAPEVRQVVESRNIDLITAADL
ncbi:MAG TPA: ChbG/HpnK family deacetylase [Acidimicrobiales bacterium]|nr:ChbG/HpnK family deacetylase [Acidimicrobiales bacterium]